MAVLSTLPAIKRPLDAPAPLRLWHLASLDAPTVALVWTLAFAWCVHVVLPPWLPAVVSLSAWTCYIADRLMDARRSRRLSSAGLNEATTLRERHRFHWRYRKFLLPAAILAAMTAVFLVLRYMPLRAQERDSALAIAALAYFGAVHSSAYRRRVILPKELLVALVFTLACAAPAFTRIPAHREALFLPAAILIALAWLNCHAIEIWESAGHASVALHRTAYLLAAGSSLIALAAALAHAQRIASLITTGSLSAALLGVLDQHRNRFSPLTLRIAADLVLLTPLALLPFA